MNLLEDQGLARERRKLGDEQARLDQPFKIDSDGIGQALCIGVNNQHLPGTKEHRFAEAVFQIHSRDAFQDDELDVRVSMIFHQNGRPSDRRGHRGVHNEAVTILGEQVPEIGQLGFPAAGFLVEPCVRVGR